MEGPSIHILADELQIFVNATIIKAYGNAAFEKEPLEHQRIGEIFAFGKQLIIQLDTHALAIHFLMYGTYRIDTERLGVTPRLAIKTSKGSFYFYNCSVKCVEKTAVKSLLSIEWDILSPGWDSKKVIKAITMHKSVTIDDILLDQEIFPGVGNIIKNEVLFLAKTSPSNKVQQLPAKKIAEITQHARQFSQKFLELRKKGQLRENLQIYRKAYCPVCNTKIIRAKTGKHNRWSFICPVCQK